MDRPLTLRAHDVRAIIDGRKTQHRDVLPQPSFEAQGCSDAALGGKSLWFDYWSSEHRGTNSIKLPCAPGDKFWVREAWAVRGVYSDVTEIGYKASERESHSEYVEQIRNDKIGGTGLKVTWPNYRQANHMPRWASRITLLVTDVRVQRVQDISEEDAIAEGAPKLVFIPDSGTFHEHSNGTFKCGYMGYFSYRHGPDAWDRNDWVVARTFEVLKSNIGEVKHG